MESTIEEEMEEKDDMGRGTTAWATEKGPQLNNDHNKCSLTSNTSPLPITPSSNLQKAAFMLAFWCQGDECKTVVWQALRLQIPHG